MANILGQITVNETNIMEVDSDPSLNVGTPAFLGTIAILKNGSIGRLFQKVGNADTEWRFIPTKKDKTRISKTAVFFNNGNNLANGTYFFLEDVIQGNYTGFGVSGLYSVVSMTLTSRYYTTRDYTIALRRKTGQQTWSTIADSNFVIPSGNIKASWDGRVDLQADDEIIPYIVSGSNGQLGYCCLVVDLIPTEDLL